MIGAILILALGMLADDRTAFQKQAESIAKQKASLEKQTGKPTDSFFTTAWTSPPPVPPAPPAPECDAMAETETAPLIAAAATSQKVDPKLLHAVIQQESAFRPCAVSAKGAMGMMQLMPETADELKVTDPFDAEQNINAGARYLKQLMDRFHGDLKLALAAYNAGPARVDGAAAVPDIAETQDYVSQILKALEKVK
jgi:soluble lytic murein transglycosylase-like protein